METIGTSELFGFLPVERHNLSLIEWIERESLKPRKIVPLIPAHSPILADYTRDIIGFDWQWRVMRIPRPNRAHTDDTRQMIEDLANVQA